MKKINKNGFTMIELIVVAALITIMGTIFLVNFRGGSRSKALDLAAEKLASDLREIQAYALNAKEYSGTIPCGWGIHYIDADSYTYYVGGKPGGFECSDVGVDRNYQGGLDTTAKAVDLLNKGEVEFAGSFNDIFFESPNPDTYINNDKSSGLSLIITLQLKTDASAQRTITVATSGKIELN